MIIEILTITDTKYKVRNHYLLNVNLSLLLLPDGEYFPVNIALSSAQRDSFSNSTRLVFTLADASLSLFP